MSFFDFFKRKKIEEAKGKELSFSNLDLFIKEKYSYYEEEKELLKSNIREKIRLLVLDLNLKKDFLKEVNLEKRKEDEKLKRIVKENINFYLNHLEKLIIDLKAIDEKLTAEEYVKKIQYIFNIFKKNSEKSIEKATILVGKEFEDINEILRVFSRDFNKIIIENNEKFEKTPRLEKIKNLKLEYDDLEKTIEEIKIKIKKQEKEKLKLEEQKKDIEEDYNNFKKSEKYLEYLKEIQKNKKEIQDFEKKLFNLKEKTNLKLLLKIFHNNEKKRFLLRSYQEKFKETLEKDKDLEIIDMIKEGLKENLENEIKELKRELQELKKEKEYGAEKERKSFEDKIRKNNHELFEIYAQIENEKKKILRFEEKINEIKKEIENNLKNFYIKLIQ